VKKCIGIAIFYQIQLNLSHRRQTLFDSFIEKQDNTAYHFYPHMMVKFQLVNLYLISYRFFFKTTSMRWSDSQKMELESTPATKSPTAKHLADGIH